MSDVEFMFRNFGSETQNMMSGWDIASGEDKTVWKIVDRGTGHVVAVCYSEESAQRVMQQLKTKGYVEE